jgi:hypothetical protein
MNRVTQQTWPITAASGGKPVWSRNAWCRGVVTVGIIMFWGTCSVAQTGQVAQSTKANHIPKEAVEFPELRQQVGVAYRRDDSLLIDLKEWPQDHRLAIPRMANVVRRIRWLHDTETAKSTTETELKLQPEIERWIVQLPKVPPHYTPVLVLELDGRPRPFPGRILTSPDRADTISLPAKYATTYGEKLRFEPQPHKNTIGYWVLEEDYAQWHLKVEEPGDYKVEILQGCGEGQGGSRVELRAAGQRLPITVQDTGHFQNFVWREMGNLHLPAGDDITIKLVAVEKAADAVMDCREIRLTLLSKTLPDDK